MFNFNRIWDSTSNKLKLLFHKTLYLFKEVQIYFRICENEYNDMQKICTLYLVYLFIRKNDMHLYKNRCFFHIKIVLNLILCFHFYY